MESLYPKPQSKRGSRDDVLCQSKFLNKIVTGNCPECQTYLLKMMVARSRKYTSKVSHFYSMNHWPAESMYETFKVHS